MLSEKISKIIRHGESETVEFKTNFNDEVIVSLNAFANSKGGSVYIGISDSGKIIGVDLHAESVVNWINEIKHKTEPSIIPDAETLLMDEKTVIVLSIKEFPVKPVSAQGRYYRRILKSNHRMSLSEISDLYLKTFNLSWDYYTDEHFALENISLGKVDKLIRQIGERQDKHEEDDAMRFLQKYELLREGKLAKAAFLIFVADFTALTGI